MGVSKYWLRLLMFGVLLGTIPVITIGWISYSISSKDIEDKVKEGNMQYLHQTQMRVDQHLKTIEMAAIQFAYSSPVTATLNEELTANDFDPIRSLSNGLNHLLTFSGVSGAIIVNMEHNWYLSTTNFGTYEQMQDRVQAEQYGKHPKSLYWLNPVHDAWLTDEAAGINATAPVIRMVLKIPPMPLTNKPREILMIDMLSSEILNYLSQSRGLGEYFIIQQDGTNLLSDQRLGQYAGIYELLLDTIAVQQAQEGFFTAPLNGQEMGITYRVSPNNGWIYMSIVSISEITSQSKKIAHATFLLGLTVLLIIGCLAFVLSRRMYTPVRKLVEYSRDVHDEPGSRNREDEFRVIEESLRKLSDTGKDLKLQVQKQYTQLKEFFVLKLLFGQISEHEYQERGKHYGFPANWVRLAVMTVQIDTLHDTRYAEKDRELLLYAINNIVGELLPHQGRFEPIVLGQSQVTIICCAHDDPVQIKEELHLTAERIRSTVKQYLQLTVSVGISRTYTHLSNTMEAFNETLQALKRRISLGHDIIVHYEDTISHYDLSTAIYSQLKLLEDQLIQAIKAGDAERIDVLLQQYLDSVRHREVSFSEYPALMIQFISKIYQIVQDQGGSVIKVLGQRGSIEAYMKLHTLQEIEIWFKKDLIEPILQFLNEQAETQYLDIANQMLKIIHEKYDEDISLETCAAILNYHPVYLSRVFKKEVGVNFIDYLVEYRMNMAKKWLETTDLKVAKIAEKLQYKNTSAFIRTFRRIAGMTPGQYREQAFKQINLG